MKTYVIKVTRTDSDGTRYDTVVATGIEPEWMHYLYRLMRGNALLKALQGDDSLCIITFEE